MATIADIQRVLGVDPDGKWGPRSQAALDAVLQPKVVPVESSEMSPRFLKMIPFLWEWEGTRFENDPDDPGGATKFGIDQRSHPKENIRNLTEARAIEIYWNEYWQRYHCEQYPFPMGEVVFNCCVNAGWGRAEKILEAGNRDANSFLKAQEQFYRNLAASRASSAKFLKGWLNRTQALRKFLDIK